MPKIASSYFIRPSDREQVELLLSEYLQPRVVGTKVMPYLRTSPKTNHVVAVIPHQERYLPAIEKRMMLEPPLSNVVQDYLSPVPQQQSARKQLQTAERQLLWDLEDPATGRVIGTEVRFTDPPFPDQELRFSPDQMASLMARGMTPNDADAEILQLALKHGFAPGQPWIRPQF